MQSQVPPLYSYHDVANCSNNNLKGNDNQISEPWSLANGELSSTVNIRQSDGIQNDLLKCLNQALDLESKVNNILKRNKIKAPNAKF